jgi:two-component system response regulator TrcR
MCPGVLIVEDERQLAKNIANYLQRSGFDVRKSENAAEGMKEFKRFRPDVVLLDVMLPDLDGLQLLQRMREFDACGSKGYHDDGSGEPVPRAQG